MQKLGRDGAVRDLVVEADGAWECTNCAGDGKTSAGTLTSAQNQELQRLLNDPALQEELDRSRGYRLQCTEALFSSLVSEQGITTFGDCPGEQPPPTAGAIVRLLTDATPAEMTR
jgi:hypothetical protein